MKKAFLIFLILNFTLKLSYAGNYSKKDSIIKERNIKINTIQLWFRDIHLTYDWEYKEDRLLHTGIGYKFGILGSEYSTNRAFTSATNFTYPVEATAENWLYGNIGHAWDIDGMYLISTDFLFRYSYQNPQYEFFHVGEEMKSDTKLWSLKKIVSGLKCTVVKKIYVFSKEPRKTKSFFEYYAGLGLRYQYKESTIYAFETGYAEIEDLNPRVPPRIEKLKRFFPTIHCGIRYGIAWNNKK